MADTIREQIIAEYMTRLALWTVANGYSYDCGKTAQRATQHVEYDELPACVLWPQSENVVQRYGQNVCEMMVKVEALAVIGDTDASAIQESLLGDVIKIMTDPSVVVTALTEDIIYTDGGPAGIIKQEEKTTAVFANFKIKYETLIGDPYSQ